MKKELLRLAARRALEGKFGGVFLTKSQGAIPGARLTYTEKGKDKLAAVRTSISSDGRIGLTRNSAGDWRTLDDVDLVVVAAPHPEDSKVIAVYAFVPNDLKKEYNRAVRASEKGNRDEERFKAPVFLPLFETRHGIARRKGLSVLCQWELKINKSELPTSGGNSYSLELLKVDMAKALGIHPNRIVEIDVQIRIREGNVNKLSELA